jgi:hypothetical protein
MSAYATYGQRLIDNFWKYQKQRFLDKEKYFEQTFKSNTRQPVFLKSTGDRNVLMEPGTCSTKRTKILIVEVSGPNAPRVCQKLTDLTVFFGGIF